MELGKCYEQLGLKSGANLAEIKASYRRLARLYHPDVNPNNEQAKYKFMLVTEAYKILLEITHTQPNNLHNNPSNNNSSNNHQKTSAKPVEKSPKAPQETKNTQAEVKQTPQSHQEKSHQEKSHYKSSHQQGYHQGYHQANYNLSESDQSLKQSSYLQLQSLLKYQRYPRAIALIEGLAQRLPDDHEVKQWQAITYQLWARQLIKEKQVEKARNYLKKALRTDPHNRVLWTEVEKDFQNLENLLSK